jgi:hypothetical protein
VTDQPDRDPRQDLLDAIDQTYAYGVLGYDSPELLVAAFEATVHATLLAAVDIGDAEAWCKTCRRVWEGPRHRCETDVERTLARVRAYAVHAIDAGDTGPGPTLGRLLLQLLDGDTAATEATRPATWLTVGTRDLSISTPDRPPVPCPACRRADQAGLAPDEQHDACTKQQ